MHRASSSFSLLFLILLIPACSRDASEEVCHDCAIARAETTCASAEDGSYVDPEDESYEYKCEGMMVVSIGWCGINRKHITLGNGAEICDPKDGSIPEDPPNYLHWSWRVEGCSQHCADGGATLEKPCGMGCIGVDETCDTEEERTACY